MQRLWWILWTASCWAVSTAALQQSTTVMLHDTCAQYPFGTRRFFLDQGQNGTIIAKNLDYDRSMTSRFSPYFSYASPFLGNGQQRICSVELTTCPSCSVRLQFKIFNLPGCNVSNNASKCSGCDHVAVKENYYATPWTMCGSSKSNASRNKIGELIYHSVGRSLTLSFIFSRNYDYAFLVEFASVANTRLISGRSGDQGVISSPHFPNVYPQDYSNEVRLQNTDYDSDSGYIRLIFDDFALAYQSYMEINDVNGTTHYMLSSSLFRPPVIMIQTNEITIRFFANGGRAPGYRATYKFINGTTPEVPEVPVTDCGGFVDNLGGVITMSNMSGVGEPARLYDCIWLVKPIQRDASIIRSHLLLRFDQFSPLEKGTTAEIRQGLTSQSPLVEILARQILIGSSPLMNSAAEYLVPSDIGFYIRLRGRLSSNFKMALVYSAFSYTECYSTREFVCMNHRCISSDLRCDGFNHCGDNSDEQTACPNRDVSPQDPSWWQLHTPNYYFPKTTSYGDMGATSLVLCTAAFGVVLFIISLLALLYRMSSHSQLMRERQARLDFIRSQIANTPEPVIEIENPPSYEAPPDYGEIAKLAQILKENSANYEQLGGLRVMVPPTPTSLTSTPTPRKGRRRDLIRQSRNTQAHLATADETDGISVITSSPAPSTRSTSTVARSRNATPQHRRVRRSPGVNIVPIHLSHAISNGTLDVPTSPPPPYEISPESPYHIFRCNEEVTQVTEMPESLTDQENVMVDCGCPGACGCSTDPIPILILQSPSSEDNRFVDAIRTDGTSPLPRPDSAAGCLLSSSLGFQSSKSESRHLSALPDQQRVMAGLFASVDRFTPAIRRLKQFTWYKSV